MNPLELFFSCVIIIELLIYGVSYSLDVDKGKDLKIWSLDEMGMSVKS